MGAAPLLVKLFVAGGRDHGGRPLDSVDRFTAEVGKPRVNMATGQVADGSFAKWEALPAMSQRRYGAAAAAVEGKLFVFGGYDGVLLQRSAEELDTTRGTWEALPSMPEERAQAGATAVFDRIFLCGGFGGGEELASVHMFDSTSRTWPVQRIPPMLRRRVDLAAVSVGYLLFAIGGSSEGESLASVEKLNLQPDLADGEENAWQEIPPMSEARRGAAAAVMRGLIWVCGGHTGSRCLNSTETFDPRHVEWMSRAPMTEPRFGASAVCMGEKLYVIGGHSGERALASMERYTVDAQKWEAMPDLPSARSVAVAAQVTNARGGADPFLAQAGAAEGSPAPPA